MGIQINGQTDTIKAIDGTMTMPGTVTYEDVSRVNVTGIVTAGKGLHVTSGSAGIGTNNPSATLHVKSSGATEIKSESTGDNALININNSSAVPWILTQRSDTANAFSFRYAGNNYVNIDTSGNLGIGLTNPSTKLEIQHIASRRHQLSYDDSLLTIKGANQNGNPESLRLIGDTLRFNTGTTGSGTEKLRVTDGGFVGIGTDNVEEIVHIYGPTEAVNSRDGVMLQHSTANANADTGLPLVWSGHIGSQSNYGLASICGRKENSNSADAAAYLQLATCNAAGSLTEKLRITSDGDVGIGTDNPYNSAGYTSLTINDSTGSQIRMRTAGNERGLIYNTNTEFAIYAHNNIPINLYGAGRALAALDYEGQFILNSQTNQSYALWRKQSPITLAQYGDYARPVVALAYQRTSGNVNFSGFFGDVIASRGSTGAGHIPIFLRVCVSSAYTTNNRCAIGLGSATFRFVTFDYDGNSYQGIQYNTDASANILLDGYYATRGFKPFSLAASSVTNITAANATSDARLSSTSTSTI